MTRHESILSLEPCVRFWARVFLGKVGWAVSLDDLVSSGWLGAIRAVDRYNTARTVSLRGYADKCVRGSILDYLRMLDPLPRCRRRVLRESGEIAPRVIALDASTIRGLSDPTADNAYRDVDNRELLQRVFAVVSLNARSKRILKAYFYKGRTKRAIAKQLGVTEGRVVQITTAAVGKLRAAADSAGITN